MSKYKMIAPDWFSQNIGHFNNFASYYVGKPDVTYLEIGVWEGRSVVWLLDNILTGNRCKIYAIDPWLPYQELNAQQQELHNQAESNFDYNTRVAIGSRDTNLVKMKMKSSEAVRKIDTETVDFAYIDGSHSAPDVLEDMVNVWRVLKRGGTMFCDDVTYGKFAGSNKDPRLAASAFVSCHKDDSVVLAHNHALVIRKGL